MPPQPVELQAQLATGHVRGLTVPVGPTTVGGTAVSMTAFAAAAVAVLNGDRTPETISLLATGTIIGALTIWGRMKQAIELAKASHQPLTPALIENVIAPTLDSADDERATVVTPKHSEPVAPHDIDIEGIGYDKPVELIADHEATDIHAADELEGVVR